jgi:hypothetical protein
MIREYGSEVHIQAAIRADEFHDKGDLDGQRTWLRIIKTIDELKSTDRGGAPLNQVRFAPNSGH